MLRQRILTAVLGLPGLIYVLGWGPYWSGQALLLACLAMSVFEFVNMLQPRLDELQVTFRSSDIPDAAAQLNHQRRIDRTPAERKKAYLILSASVAVLATFWAWIIISSPGLASRGLVIVGVVVTVVGGIFTNRGIDAQVARAFGLTIALVFGGLPWLSVMDLLAMGPSSRYVFLLLIIVWCGDTGGYFGGRFFGKHKLAPHKSPKKTWEGAIAGLLASIAGALLYNHLINDAAGTVGLVIVAALCTGIAGQLGDLSESVIKRFSKVKDSGAIFPAILSLLPVYK